MHLAEVRLTDRAAVRDFLRLPFDLYRDIPQWVPSLMPGERARFKRNFPFYTHSEASFYLVRDASGRAVGRVVILDHRPFNEFHGTRHALLYLYEAVENDEVAACLFDAATSWARARGLTQLVGPKGFLPGDSLGLLVEGFEHSPALGITYNPPYYIRHWEHIGGMSKEIDYLSAFIHREGYEYPQRLHDLAARMRERKGYHVPVFRSKKDLLKYVPALVTAYNESFRHVWSFMPVNEAEIRAALERMLLVAEPHMLKLIFKDDEVIGFQFAYPDISEAIRRQRGEVWPFGWIDMLRERRRTKWININGNAILPKYQGLGANAVLYDEMAKTLLDSTHYQYADLVQVQESNAKMLADLAAVVPVNIYKRHRIYHRSIS